MKSTTYLLLLCVLVLSACQKDDPILEIPNEYQAGAYANVPVALWDYFERFEQEAEARGVAVSLQEQSITAEIMEIDDEGVAGTCTYGSHRPGHIVIDEEFWNQASDLFKEMIIFHELGHCSLFRDHREGVLGNGACVSIMRSGLENCRDNYRLATREFYLDELFQNQ